MKIKVKTINDIMINEYRDILTIIEHGEDSIENNIKIISTLTDLSEKELLDYEYSSIRKLVDMVNEIISKPVEEELVDIEIEGIKYGFDEKLDKMKTGMFIDLYNFTKDNDKINDNLHIVSAILFRPKVNGKLLDYNSESVITRADIFNKHMSISVAQNICFFFLILRQKSLEKIVASLGKQLK